jgi:hypothetical protein
MMNERDHVPRSFVLYAPHDARGDAGRERVVMLVILLQGTREYNQLVDVFHRAGAVRSRWAALPQKEDLKHEKAHRVVDIRR